MMQSLLIVFQLYYMTIIHDYYPQNNCIKYVIYRKLKKVKYIIMKIPKNQANIFLHSFSPPFKNVSNNQVHI